MPARRTIALVLAATLGPRLAWGQEAGAPDAPPAPQAPPAPPTPPRPDAPTEPQAPPAPPAPPEAGAGSPDSPPSGRGVTTPPEGRGRLTSRPRVLVDAQPLYPPEAWNADAEGDVVLLLLINVDGLVQEAEVISTPGWGMETAALVAAKDLRFAPAEVDGVPAKVKVRYTFRFRKGEKASQALPPPAPRAGLAPEDPRPKGTLMGTVVQRGTGRPLHNAEVYLLDLDAAVLTDEAGHFEKEVSPGGYALTINVPGHHPFEALERVDPGDVVEVRYFVEQKRRERYRTVVWGSEGKATVGRTSLTDAEIYEVPGTLGDPIRVVMLLPGVTTSVSGIGYPVVRGVLPGDTLYEVDGVQVPMLYHLMFGNAVVNPRFTSGITFQPGGYSVRHGGFPGALISADGGLEADQAVTAGDVSLIQASLFHAQPLSEEVSVQASGRYGTLGLIIEGIASDVIFRYWDYQTKAHWHPSKKDEVQVMAFGASNVVGGEKEDGTENVFEMGFHRGLVRWRHAFPKGWLRLEVEGGQEGFDPPDDEGDEPPEDRGPRGPEGPKPPGPKPPEPGPAEGEGEAEGEDGEPPPQEDMTARYEYVALRAEGSWSPLTDVELHLGGDGFLQDFGFEVPSDEVHSADDGLTLSAYLEAEWTPGDWTVVPGVRIDHYRYGLDSGHRETGVDPRLAVAWDATDWLTVKASAGIHRGPPRVSIVAPPVVMGPVPGIVGFGLDRGLSRSTQLAAGLEFKLPWRFEARVDGFSSWTHTPLDFSVIEEAMKAECVRDDCMQDPGKEQPEEAGEDVPMETDGRSYGLELMLRRRLGESVFGWLTYTLARSEREVEGYGTFPFVFDQTHVVNAVVSWEVGRHWTLGATFHYNTGRPYTPYEVTPCPALSDVWGDEAACRACLGERMSARLPDYWRLDVRVQKRELFDTWYFDFYVDVFNVTFNWETVGYEVDWDCSERPMEIPIFVPMLGLRGQF